MYNGLVKSNVETIMEKNLNPAIEAAYATRKILDDESILRNSTNERLGQLFGAIFAELEERGIFVQIKDGERMISNGDVFDGVMESRYIEMYP